MRTQLSSPSVSEWPRDGSPPAGAPGAAGDSASRYRHEASRMIGLAATSPFSDTTADFLRLAQHYEKLAAIVARHRGG